MIATTPSGTRVRAISSPFGRRQPSSTSPTGSGRAATVRSPFAIAVEPGVGEPQAVERARCHARRPGPPRGRRRWRPGSRPPARAAGRRRSSRAPFLAGVDARRRAPGSRPWPARPSSTTRSHPARLPLDRSVKSGRFPFTDAALTSSRAGYSGRLRAGVQGRTTRSSRWTTSWGKPSGDRRCACRRQLRSCAAP